MSQKDGVSTQFEAQSREKNSTFSGLPTWISEMIESQLNRRDGHSGSAGIAIGTLLNDSESATPSDSDRDSEGERRLAFRTLDAEVTDHSLPVEGKLPSWLEGTLLRTGPAKFEVGDRSLRHWFDGFAMLHRFAIDTGSVKYSNKYLETEAYTHATDEGELGYREFTTDPCRRIWERFFSIFKAEATDNANVNIATHAEQFVSMTETPLPVEFDPETLETLGVVDYENEFGDMTTAHPHIADGQTFNYVTDFSRTSEYKVYRMPDDEFSRDIITTISRDRPAYMHSFGLTANYILLVEFPFVVNPIDLLVRNRPLIEIYRWEPERGTRFSVIDRETGDVVADPITDAFFAFHHVNAYEEDDVLVVDIVIYDDVSVINDLYLDELESPDAPREGGRLVQFRVDDEISRETLFPGPIELPRINYDRVNAEPYRFVYGVGNTESPPRDLPNTLVKVDIDTGETKVWDEPGTYPGEPVFVESPDPSTEDDGVVLSVVLDSDSERSFLLVLDAGTFGEIARAPVPHHVPLGFHGGFYDV